MFRFWTSESRGCDKDSESLLQTHSELEDTFHPVRTTYDSASMPAAVAAKAQGNPMPSTKRKHSLDANSMMPPSPSTEFDPPADQEPPFPPTKRIKSESDGASWPHTAFGASYGPRNNAADRLASPPTPPVSVAPASQEGHSIEEVIDIVDYQFSHEILLKHNELRLIEQEMAKCQIAMEQLRRCHLIPYPFTCPTPQQMMDIAGGRGTVVRPRPGAAVPKWSSPFGVVDGPYSRHYAKWLIPDPVFDGDSTNFSATSQLVRAKTSLSADTRSTRTSVGDSSKGRPTRTSAGQKLQSLSSGYPPVRDRAGPCVMKRSDGIVVKLVCTDCKRDNFSSTQGFINHCRIAHKREYRSHDEAAIHCGQPIEVDDAPPQATASKKRDVVATPKATSASASVSCAGSAVPALATASVSVAAPVIASSITTDHFHQLTHADDGVANALLERIESSNKAYCRAALSKGEAFPSSRTGRPSSSFVGSDATPYLSSFLEKKQFAGNLDASVEDAREASDLDSVPWYAFGLAEDDLDTPDTTTPPPAMDAMRAPARAPKSSTPATSYDAADENATSACLSFGSSSAASPSMYTDEMEVDLSPNPSASNNAPSLVSDDGEYDDSDDGSASESSDVDMSAVSDVPEINNDEDEDQVHHTPQQLRHHRGSVKLKKDDSKHVTFVSPLKGSNKARRN